MSPKRLKDALVAALESADEECARLAGGEHRSRHDLSGYSSGDARRLYFALGMIGTALFLLLLCSYLPSNGRWMFIGMSIVVFIVGAIELDISNKGRATGFRGL